MKNLKLKDRPIFKKLGEIKTYFSNDWKKQTRLRNFELTPAITLNFYNNYKFESIRISWLGFLFKIYFER